MANLKSTQTHPSPLPNNLGPASTLPRARTVSKGTANLVTIKTEDIVWNPPHTGTQLTKKLASFTKPPFYESRTEKTAVFSSVYPTGFPITKYFKTKSTSMNVFIQIGLSATGRLLKHRASREQRSSHTGPVPLTVPLSCDSGMEVFFPIPGISRENALLTLQSYRATQLWPRLSSARPVVVFLHPSLSPLCTALPSHLQARHRPERPTDILTSFVITSMLAVPKNRGSLPPC